MKFTFTINDFEGSTEALGTSSWRTGWLWFELQGNSIALGQVAPRIWPRCSFNTAHGWPTAPPIVNVNRVISLQICLKNINLKFSALLNNKSPLALLRIRESLTEKPRRDKFCDTFFVIQAVCVEATCEKHENQTRMVSGFCAILTQELPANFHHRWWYEKILYDKRAEAGTYILFPQTRSIQGLIFFSGTFKKKALTTSLLYSSLSQKISRTSDRDDNPERSLWSWELLTWG